MRLRHRFGEPLAHAVLHRALESGAARPADLLSYAEALNVLGTAPQAALTSISRSEPAVRAAAPKSCCGDDPGG